jgi:uncharacterized caspase-like protein
MIEKMLWRFLKGAAMSVIAVLGGVVLAPAGMAASAGLAVVIANSYDEHLPASLRDADAIAGKLEQNGFDAIRLLGTTGGETAAALARIRQAAETAGPVRVVYMSGFGMCFNDDLVLFAEDMQPEQFRSGQIGDVVVPLSVVAAAVADGAARTLLVFDTNPRQCTRDMIDAVRLPDNAALLVTTGIGGDVVDEVDEGGMSAFATAFAQAFAADRPLKDIVAEVVAEIREITEGQQDPILIGNL